MALTRKMLKDLQLEDSTIEAIIAAHAATIEGLTTERDELRSAAAETEKLRSERDELRAQVDELTAAQIDAENARQTLLAYQSEQELQLRTAAIRAALAESGCNETVIPLVANEINPTDICLEDGHIVHAEELIAPLKEKYAALFAKPVRLPTPTVNPPIASGGAITREDLSRMTTEEINRNWNAVKGVLSKGVI